MGTVGCFSSTLLAALAEHPLPQLDKMGGQWCQIAKDNSREAYVQSRPLGEVGPLTLRHNNIAVDDSSRQSVDVVDVIDRPGFLRGRLELTVEFQRSVDERDALDEG